MISKKNRRLVAYRKMLQLSQTDMSKILGISLSAYSQKETGKLDFTQSEMFKTLLYMQNYNKKITVDEIFFSSEVIITIT